MTRERVPVRTILTTIGLVLTTVVLLYLVTTVHRVLVWMLIAGFFAVALFPAVDWVERRLTRGHRWLATLLVFTVVLAFLVGLAAVFIVPLVREGTQLAQTLPQTIEDAQNGKGTIGRLLERTHALEYLRENRDRVEQFTSGLGTPALAFLRSAATGVVAAITIFVLAYLMVLEGPRIVSTTQRLLPPEPRERVRKLGTACARTIGGYITGNLLISVICGLLTFGVLKILGVPFAGLIALFVAIVDLIPIVGATLGALVATLAALTVSVPAAVIVLVFFIVYQQVENHLLQPVIYARTVRLNPLTVIVAILIAAELAGVLGALLAIPVAGVAQILLRDWWEHRRPVGEESGTEEPPGESPTADEDSRASRSEPQRST